MIPLFFQVILEDTPSEAGLRMVIPSLATPVGGLVSGIIMSRWGKLNGLVRTGCFFMMLGNGLVASLKFQDSSWKHLVFLFPANFGQGMCYPAILFTFIAAFDHSRKYDSKVRITRRWLTACRTSGFYIACLFVSIHGDGVGCGGVFHITSKRVDTTTSPSSGRYSG